MKFYLYLKQLGCRFNMIASNASFKHIVWPATSTGRLNWTGLKLWHAAIFRKWSCTCVAFRWKLRCSKTRLCYDWCSPNWRKCEIIKTIETQIISLSLCGLDRGKCRYYQSSVISIYIWLWCKFKHKFMTVWWKLRPFTSRGYLPQNYYWIDNAFLLVVAIDCRIW